MSRLRMAECGWPAVLGVLLGMLGGCVTHVPMVDEYEGPDELPPAIAARYRYAPAPQPTENQSQLYKRRPGFLVREVLLPSIVAEREIRLEYYDVPGPAMTPVVVLLPILNGNLIVSRFFARYFVQRGYAAVVVDRERPEIATHLSDPEQVIRQNIMEYRRVLDWVGRNPEFDLESIGLFGVSRGGIEAVVLAALDERVDAVVAAFAGGDLSYLLLHTRYRSVSRAVSEFLTEEGLSRNALERHLRQSISTDPLNLAPYVDAEDLLMVLARGDVIVPFEKQQELRASLGGPEAIYLPTGHRTSVIYFPWLRSSAYEFFARRFD